MKIHTKNCQVIPGKACLTEHRLYYAVTGKLNVKMPKIQKGKRIKM